jgi:dihydrolipoamide dehydrogenase
VKTHYDLMVVGGGPGGYVAAIRASQLGFRTALVEREALGGVCLNWGCIPTKALLRGAEIAHTLRTAGDFGFTVGPSSLDLEVLVGHSRSVAAGLSKGIAQLLRKHGVTHIQGHARLAGKCSVSVRGDGGSQTTYQANHIVLATGARPRQLPGIVVDGERIWGAREAMTPTQLPQRLLVIGAGAIGVEFASLYADLGSEVTLVEMADGILPGADDEIATRAKAALSERGIRILTGHSLVQIAPRGQDALTATLAPAGGSNQLEVETDRAILAVGVTGNVEDLGLEGMGAEVRGGFLVTDDWGYTGVVGLYAIGDVAGPPWLAHKASHQAVQCVEHIAGVGRHQALQTSRVPTCIYSRPQIASVGLTEAQARAEGRPIRVGRAPLQANGKALAMGEGKGLVKTLFDEATGELLGAHLIGPEVTELVQGFTVARQLEATENDLLDTVFPHPTLSESMHESVLDALNRAIHH